jgi:hypothetical protein
MVHNGTGPHRCTHPRIRKVVDNRAVKAIMETLFTIVGVFVFLFAFVAIGSWFLFDEIGQGIGILILVFLFVGFMVATI